MKVLLELNEFYSLFDVFIIIYSIIMYDFYILVNCLFKSYVSISCNGCLIAVTS